MIYPSLNDEQIEFDWDEAIYKQIAVQSGSKQAVKDVKFGRFGMYHDKSQMITIHIGSKSFAIARMTKKGLHIYGIATVHEHKRNGLGGHSCWFWK